MAALALIAALAFQSAEEFRASGAEKLKRADIPGAIEDFTKALALEPENVDVLLYRARAYAFGRQHDKAAGDYTKVIALKPGMDTAYADRGECLRILGRLDDALADFNKAIEIEPGGARHFTHRGRLFVEKSRLDDARADFTQAIDLYPRMAATPYAYRAHVNLLTGDLAKAVEDAGASIGLNPVYGFARITRGRVLYAKGDWAGAVEDFEAKGEVTRRMDAAVWSWCARARAGDSKAADEALSARLKSDERSKDEWVEKVAGFLLGGIAAEDLLRSAGDKDAERRGDAELFIGTKLLIAGDKDGARERFARCAESGVVQSVTRAIAKAELKRLTE